VRRKKQRVSSMAGLAPGLWDLRRLEFVAKQSVQAARGLLDWSQAELAHRARVGIVTVRQFEAGAHAPRRATIEVIKRAFEAAGAEFIDENGGGPGVRIRKRRPRKNRG
jgi:ribosome-binding protein aMBF1 (putative translation factor)